MKKKALKFEDFQDEKLSKKQQKTVRGGDGDIDPGKGSGGSGNNDEEETQRIIQPVIKPNT
ncbi:hypothetical protein [Flavobacterium reichenbachii]|uniref:Uncharacterized protein n=1 Tax=Flavobacterium reichenbachii TaxID=362418 RepID=A0A085ZRX1_9FLAO|nr:hypothetical protein [Flavobacterium reichenbachii]KFF07185.1 hypothetical protein IW19_17465 [Flavobacterium reichenbachii]OXB13321.1 hypothetical protein B0A68_16325 [Flavobacterium reichenbachii]